MNLLTWIVIAVLGIGIEVPQVSAEGESEEQTSLVDSTNGASLLYNTEEEIRYVYSITDVEKEGAVAPLLGNDIDDEFLMGPEPTEAEKAQARIDVEAMEKLEGPAKLRYFLQHGGAAKLGQ